VIYIAPKSGFVQWRQTLANGTLALHLPGGRQLFVTTGSALCTQQRSSGVRYERRRSNEKAAAWQLRKTVKDMKDFKQKRLVQYRIYHRLTLVNVHFPVQDQLFWTIYRETSMLIAEPDITRFKKNLKTYFLDLHLTVIWLLCRCPVLV